jgi:lipopolysaccharide export LptBFGC system permease protein LptF
MVIGQLNSTLNTTHIPDESQVEDYLKKKWQTAASTGALDHLNLHIDLSTNTIRVETEARDGEGNPLVSFTVDEEGNFQDPLSAIIYKALTDPTPAKPQEETKPENSTTNNNQVIVADIIEDEKTIIETLVPKSSSKLTQEEEFQMQRQVALKVVFFFVSFIFVCFGLLYLYHRIQQASIPQRVETKQNFFEFLAGSVEEDVEYGQLPSSRYVR